MTLVPASSHGGGALAELQVTSLSASGDFADLEIVNASDVEVRKTSTAGSGFHRFNQDGAAYIFAKVAPGVDDLGNIIRIREYDTYFYSKVAGHTLLIIDRDNTALGFYDHAPTAQPAAIPSAAGGVVIDVEARAALNALLAAVRSNGLIAT